MKGSKMEEVMTVIESVYDRLRAAQEENAELRKKIADLKELFEDMKGHRDECFKLAQDAIRAHDELRKKISDFLAGGAA
jgi:cell division septum initiation protein DivIVA